MVQRKLEIHTFYLKETKRDEIVNPKNIFGKDLFEELRNSFLKFVDELPPSRLKNKTTKISKGKDGKSLFKFNENQRILYGKINIGDDNSKEQDVVLANRDKKVLYTKMKGHSVERPFFFMIILPENKDTGFLLIEREGKHAMKMDFGKILNEFVNANLSGLKIKFKNFVEQELIKEWLTEGEYKEIIYSRKHISNDKAETYLGGYKNDGEFDVKLSLIPKKGTLIPKNVKQKIVNRIDSYNGFFESSSFNNLGFDKETDIKVIVDYEGNVRTIDLSDTHKVRPYYHIEVQEDNNGFSNLDSISKEALTLIESFNIDI